MHGQSGDVNRELADAILSGMTFESIRLITFDCYGTLIDWETGMLAAMRPLFRRGGRDIGDAQLLEAYGEAEVELESRPYLTYREVLSRSVQDAGKRLGVTISAEQAHDFAESLTRWEPFPDTVSSLQELSKRFRLGIISNVDDDLFAVTRKKLNAPFDVVVTAQQVKSYKPSFRNFEEMLRRSGLKKEEVLHAAQSVYHDIVPANALGITNVWVNRPSIRPGSGATKTAQARPTAEVGSLAELVSLLAH
jgi:2-haloacid dehalogenase